MNTNTVQNNTTNSKEFPKKETSPSDNKKNIQSAERLAKRILNSNLDINTLFSSQDKLYVMNNDVRRYFIIATISISLSVKMKFPLPLFLVGGHLQKFAEEIYNSTITYGRLDQQISKLTHVKLDENSPDFEKAKKIIELQKRIFNEINSSFEKQFISLAGLGLGLGLSTFPLTICSLSYGAYQRGMLPETIKKIATELLHVSKENTKENFTVKAEGMPSTP